MNLKVLMLLLIYYSIVSLMFISTGSILSDKGYINNIELNDGTLTTEETDTGGLFGTGVNFGRFFSLITIGIGLPSTTPSWFAVLFSAWQSIVLIFSIGFVISSIWNG